MWLITKEKGSFDKWKTKEEEKESVLKKGAQETDYPQKRFRSSSQENSRSSKATYNCTSVKNGEASWIA